MLKIENMHKAYGKTKALDGLNLEIEKGSIYGFVGPNGAGKTTTMKLIAGLLKPDEGQITLGDEVLQYGSQSIRKRIGYMPDFFGVYDNLLVHEYLAFFGALYELSSEQIKLKTAELLELVQLSDKANDPVDSLSRGMKQRLCLARALIHEPELLLLDEPASGMDPIARIQMKDILKTLSQQGQTILISSHILPELSEICTTIGMIHQGKMIQQGTMSTLDRTLGDSLKIQFKHLASNSEEQVAAAIATTSVKHWQRIDPQTVIAELSTDEDGAAQLLRHLSTSLDIYQFQILEDSLETLFKKAIMEEGEVSVHEA